MDEYKENREMEGIIYIYLFVLSLKVIECMY